MNTIFGQLFIVLGVICILASVAGGGVKGFGVEISANLSGRRQIAVGILGAVFIGLGIGILPSTSRGNTPTTPSVSPSVVGRAPTAAAPASRVQPSASRRRPKAEPSPATPTTTSPTTRSYGSGAVDGPSIRSVTAIRPTRNQVIVIEGSGFGTAPSFNGQTPYLRITDLTHGNWIAGWSDSPTYTYAWRASILVSEWSDTKIVVEQITDYGTLHGSVAWTFNAGDVVKIEVANAQGRTLPPPGATDQPWVAAFTARVTN